MAELTPSEKLQPCLLDRLTDDEPDQQQESRHQKVMSMKKYREAVLRDVTWLLNTYANAARKGIDAYEHLPSSVLNYGVQSLAGMTVNSVSTEDIRYGLIEALRRFEPRIIPNTVSISMTVDPEEMSNRSIQFEIRGDLWNQPIPESLFIKTELDLETGKYKLNRS